MEIVGKARHAQTLGVHASKRVIAIIEQRAEPVGMSKSKFASLILNGWVAQGCPPVCEPDRLLQMARGPANHKKKS